MFLCVQVFLREELERSLESKRIGIEEQAAVVIQKFVKGKMARKKYLQKRNAALLIQRNARMWTERKKYLKLRKGVVAAQANYRMIRQKRRFNLMKVRSNYFDCF